MIKPTKVLHHIRPISKGKQVRNGNGRLPANVLAYLEKKYHLLPQDMLNLRLVKCKGTLGRLPAQFVRIYNQVEAYNNGLNIKKYNDLTKYPDIALYDGYIIPNGPVHLKSMKNNAEYAS